MSEEMSLRPRPGETPEDVLERITKTARISLGIDSIAETLVDFSYYLHDNYTTGEMIEYLSEKTGIPEVVLNQHRDELAGTFYEIELACRLNTVDWKIEILEIKST